MPFCIVYATQVILPFLVALSHTHILIHHQNISCAGLAEELYMGNILDLEVKNAEK